MNKKFKIPLIFFLIGTSVAIFAHVLFISFNPLYSYLLAQSYSIWFFPFRILGVAPRGENPEMWYYLVTPIFNGLYYSIILSLIYFGVGKFTGTTKLKNG